MVGRPDSLQTAPHLHDRMWELDGFGDYMKHSFHFQFIVLRRGITFTQMARNLEMHSFCESQNVHGRRRSKKTSKRESMVLFLYWGKNCVEVGIFKWAAAAVTVEVFKPHGHSLAVSFMGGCRDTAGTIIVSIMVRSLWRSAQGTYYCTADWHHPDRP